MAGHITRISDGVRVLSWDNQCSKWSCNTCTSRSAEWVHMIVTLSSFSLKSWASGFGWAACKISLWIYSSRPRALSLPALSFVSSKSGESNALISKVSSSVSKLNSSLPCLPKLPSSGFDWSSSIHFLSPSKRNSFACSLLLFASPQ